MKFKDYLIQQMQCHPSLGPQDIVKQCYQAAKGAEHLLMDRERAKAYFDEEYRSVEICEAQKKQPESLYEPIAEDVCRVNLRAWKQKGLEKDWLFEMFASSAMAAGNGEDRLAGYLEAADRVIRSGQAPFAYDAWQEYLEDYRHRGMPAVHHSEKYRAHEEPAYRIVNTLFLRLIPILEKVAAWMREQSSVTPESMKQGLEGNVCVIAVEGRAASGKSTMASQLQQILGAGVIHMDDFFLPLSLRTQERFRMPGGNVHYERFREEVLPYLKKPEEFSYRLFDCSRMDFHGERRIEESRIRIVEGSYSLHPVFGAYADIMVFSDVDKEEQMRRIISRNGSEMAEIFRNRWILLEEDYFASEKMKIVISKCMLL